MNLKAIELVSSQFAAVLEHVTTAELGRPTPCPPWTVQELFDHVVTTNDEFSSAVSGHATSTRTPPDLPGRYARSASRLVAAFAEVSDESALVTIEGTPGPRPIADVAEMYVTDTLLHAWDLSAALGHRLPADPALVTLVLRRLQLVPDQARGPGKPFGYPLPARHDDPDDFERVLLLSGRDPAWSGERKTDPA